MKLIQSFWRTISGKFEELCSRRVSALPLAWFRIIFGISVLIEAWNLYYFRTVFFSPDFFLGAESFAATLLLITWIISSVLITAGWQFRAAAVINYLWAVIFLGLGAASFGFEWHVDSLILSGSLLLLLMPADRALSVTSYLQRKKQGTDSPYVSYIWQVLLMLLIGGVYLDSIFWKVTSDMYLSGLALWAPASLPFNVYLDFQWILDLKYPIYAASAIVLFYETSFIFLVWFNGWRTLLLVLGILFHIAIGIFFPLPAFGLIMAGFLVGGLPVRDFAAVHNFIFRRPFRFYPMDDPGADDELKEVDEIPENPKKPLVTGLYKKVIAVYLAFWFVSLIVIHFRSPFYITYAGDAEGFWRIPLYAGGVYKNWVYPYSGFSTHGLYVDSHFRDYNRQYKFVYDGIDGEKIIPVIRDNGMAGWYNFGRNHIYWTFRTASPIVSESVREERMQRFIHHWLARQKAMDTEKEIEIEIREQQLTVSLDEFIPGLLHRNMEGPWNAAGMYRITSGDGRFSWNDEGETANAR
jgi:hypothetical protein